jgi:protein SCO1/2
MRTFVLTFTGFISLAWAAAAGRTYQVDGIIVDVLRPERAIVVSHRPIPGYMPAMTMRFPVADQSDLSGLQPGSRVQFELSAGGDMPVARKIRAVVPTTDVALRSDRLRVGDTVPDFAFIDQAGRHVRLSDFRGRVMVMDFIYTRCPVADMCPRLSANFAAVQKRFERTRPHEVVLLSLTIDPLNDTPQVLSDYAKRWGADPHDWYFLTAPMQQMKTVAEKFGLIYWPDDDAITHNATTTIVGPDAKVAAIVDGSTYRLGQLCDLIERQLGGKE